MSSKQRAKPPTVNVLPENLVAGSIIYFPSTKPTSERLEVIRVFWCEDADRYEVHYRCRRFGETATTYPKNHVLELVI